jgi:uncharacterized protein DUF5677
MSGTFEEIGYLSPEIEAFREGTRAAHSAEFAKLESSVRVALEDLRSINGATSDAYLVGLGYWLRCIESCQGVALLAERGMAAIPFAALRTAYECLFYACALWRKPMLIVKFELLHHQERIKQAREMLNAGAEARVPPDRLSDLKGVAAETPPSEAGISAWEAAGAADLVFEYQTVYRGCGLAGAHASLRSLDGFYAEHQDGSISLRLEPDAKRISWLLGLVDTCLQCGIRRRREAHGSLVP